MYHHWVSAGNIKHSIAISKYPISRDSIIGAHAVVNKNVPEFAIAAGVPAKFLWDRRKGKEHNEILSGTESASRKGGRCWAGG
jgi:serine acetyltransferase